MTILTMAFLVCLAVHTGTPSTIRTQFTSGVTQQSTTAELVKAELDTAAIVYRAGKFVEAEQHSRRAVELDPNNKTARAFVARTVHAQYQPGITTEENLAKARQAIAEYKNMLSLSPKDDEAYKAIAYLLGALKEYRQLREWISKRANDESIEAEKRSEAYVVLASKNWDCSFQITEQIEIKVTSVDDNGKVKVTYKMPKDPSVFQTAMTCASEGLAEVDHAISLDPTSESAWSYKVNLLLERSKLSEMERRMDQKAQFDKLADDALKELMRLQKKTP
jgi:tetratricopeptide (TPR) repeat protein